MIYQPWCWSSRSAKPRQPYYAVVLQLLTTLNGTATKKRRYIRSPHRCSD